MKHIDKTSKRTLVFILGNLTAFGPFVTDFYLPCLPELTSFFLYRLLLFWSALQPECWGWQSGNYL